jgi:hypothetical protein
VCRWLSRRRTGGWWARCARRGGAAVECAAAAGEVGVAGCRGFAAGSFSTTARDDAGRADVEGKGGGGMGSINSRLEEAEGGDGVTGAYGKVCS